MSDAESLGSSAMEEDEDDLYGDAPQSHSNANATIKQDEDGEEDASDEEYESDNSIEIITEKPQDEEETIVQISKPTPQTVTITDPRSLQTTVLSQNEAAPSKSDDASSKPQMRLQSGKAYPEVRSSTVDVDGNPVFPSAGKPVTEIEIDADLAEHEKPWRRPGADQSDYFNYGFDEFTWSTYCLRQGQMAQALAEIKAENRQFEQMFGGGGGGMMPGMPQMPAMPTNMPGMGAGMPDPQTMAAMMGMNNQDMFQMMQQAMAEQGISDPDQLDIGAVMAKMQGGGGMGQGAPSGPSTQHQNYGGGNWQQQGGYGRGKRGGRW